MRFYLIHDLIHPQVLHLSQSAACADPVPGWSTSLGIPVCEWSMRQVSGCPVDHVSALVACPWAR